MNKLRKLFTWGLLAVATHAMGVNITVNPIEIVPGETANLVINMQNTETNLTAYQMSLYLPNGITVQKKSNGKYAFTANADRHDGAFTVTVKDAADGSILITCFSADKDVLTGTSGELIRLPLDVASTVTTSLQGSIKNMEFTNVNAQATKPANITFAMTMSGTTPPVGGNDDLTVSVPDMSVAPGGTTDLVINMNTTATDLTAYQMSLYLPNGITVQKKSNGKYDFTANADRHDGAFTVTVKDAADGSILITCFSADKDVLTGTSGELIRLPLDVASTVTTSLQGSIKNMEFTNVSAQATKPADITFTITPTTKEAQTLSLSAIPEMTEGDAAYTLPQQTAQGLTLTWSVADATIASISGNKLTPLKAGTTTVTATQAGNATYQAFSKTFTLTVNEKPAVPTVDVTDISQMNNVIYIEPMDEKTGTQVTISIKMKNSAAIRGFQFDLYLPTGVTVVKSSKGKIQGFLSEGRLPEEDEHSLTFSEQSDGAIRFLCSSQYDETFTGNDGEIATLKVDIAADMADGDYAIQMKNMKLTETNISNYYETALVQSKLTVSSYTLGDINNDGTVDVLDYTGVANHIHGNTPDGFVVKAGDVDENGTIDVSDYTGIANLIHYNSIYGNTSNSRGMMLSPRKANTDLSSYENVIYITPFTVSSGTQTAISIKMKNSVAIRGFQFDLYLPDGMTVVKSNKGRIQGALSAGRLPEDDEHELTFSEQPDGAIRFLCSSQYDETFTGNDGEIATLQVDIAPGMANGNYPILLKTVKLTETDISKYYEAELIETTVTIGEAVIVYTVLDENSTDVPAATSAAVDIKVLRTIKAGEWSTICLPFAMTGAEVKAAFGDGVQLADFVNYEINDEATQLSVNIDALVPANGIESNYPYLIKASKDVEEFTAKAIIEPEEANATVEYDNGKSGSRRQVYGTFYGTFHAQTVVPMNCLFISGNQFWYSKGLTKMKAFRAYFDFVDILASVEGSSSRIIMNFSDDTTTGISSSLMNSEKVDNRVYDLQGRRVVEPVKKGLYIVNGKKVFIR